MPIRPKKLQITPIPKPLWEINLRSVLPKSQWAEIRRSKIEKHGCKCVTCGKKAEKSDLQANEEWTYDTTVSPAAARISQILLQCRRCHACEHFFRIERRAKEGKLPLDIFNDLIQHFCAVNGVDKEEFDRHKTMAWNEWKGSRH